MEPIRKKIACNLRYFRKRAGLSVDEVGLVVSKSGKTISAWERGQGQPDADELIALCVLFGVDVADFYSLGESHGAELSEEERRLVSMFRGMDASGRTALLAAASGLLDAFRASEEE